MMETIDLSLNENLDNNVSNNDNPTLVDNNDNEQILTSHNDITMDNVDKCIRTRSGRHVRIPERYKK